MFGWFKKKEVVHVSPEKIKPELFMNDYEYTLRRVDTIFETIPLNIASERLLYDFGSWNDDEKKRFDPLTQIKNARVERYSDTYILQRAFASVMSDIMHSDRLHTYEKNKLFSQVYNNENCEQWLRKESLNSFIDDFLLYGKFFKNENFIDNILNILSHDEVFKKFYLRCLWRKLEDYVKCDKRVIETLLSDANKRMKECYRFVYQISSDPIINPKDLEEIVVLKQDVYLDSLFFIVNYEKYGITDKNIYTDRANEDIIRDFLGLESFESHIDDNYINKVVYDLNSVKVKNNILGALGNSGNLENVKRRM